MFLVICVGICELLVSLGWVGYWFSVGWLILWCVSCRDWCGYCGLDLVVVVLWFRVGLNSDRRVVFGVWGVVLWVGFVVLFGAELLYDDALFAEVFVQVGFVCVVIVRVCEIAVDSGDCCRCHRLV